MTITVGIAGPGAIAARHAVALRAAGARLAGVCGPDPAVTARFAERYGCAAAHPDLDALLSAPGLDAVVICSPNAFHVPQTLAALRVGCHVLCEVPVAMSLADALEVVSVAAGSGRQVMAAHTLRFCPPYRRARDLVESGLRVRHAVGRTLMLRQADTRGWTDDVLWHHGAHLVDAALWLLDADAEVAGARGLAWRGSGRPMDAGAVLTTPDGGLATLSLSYHSRSAARDLLLIAEDTTLTLTGGSLLGPSGVLAGCGGDDAMERAGLAAQDAAFVAAVAQGRPVPLPITAVLPALRALATWSTA